MNFAVITNVIIKRVHCTWTTVQESNFDLFIFQDDVNHLKDKIINAGVQRGIVLR